MSQIKRPSAGAPFGAIGEGGIAAGRLYSARDHAPESSKATQVSAAGLAALRAAPTEGEASGPATPFDIEAFIEGEPSRG
jgi:antitoxin ParD1/3/4